MMKYDSDPFEAFGALASRRRGPPAQAPSVEKVEPPNWWAGHSINPVRVLVRGKNLTGARVDVRTPNVRAPKVNAAGTYAFVDVTIPAGTAPGSYPLTLRTAERKRRRPVQRVARPAARWPLPGLRAAATSST